jgi:DNA-binding XRE family transcriptional regulator
MNGYGVILRQWRDKKGLSQRQLAKALECSDGYIGLIETAAKVPSEEICTDLIRILQPSPQDEQAFFDAVNDARRQAGAGGRRRRSAVVRDMMHIEYLPALPIADFIHEIPSAQCIRILDTFTYLVNDDEIQKAFTQAIIAALEKAAEIQILLINPSSYGAKQRARELERASVPLKNAFHLLEQTLARFYKLQSDLEEYEKNHKFAIKLYDASPSIALHRWDDQAYFSFFHMNQRSDNAPNLKIAMLDRMGRYISSRFDELWGHPTSIYLRSYMEVQVKIYNITVPFYYKIVEEKRKENLYVVCQYRKDIYEFLNSAIHNNKTINFTVSEQNYSRKLHELKVDDLKSHNAKDQIIKDIMERYEWSESDKDNYIGNNPDIFFVRMPSQSQI